MAPFLPVRAANRSNNVRIGGKKILTNRTTYVDLSPTPSGQPWSTFHELQNHQAIGQLVVVGPLTYTNPSAAVQVTGATVSITTPDASTEFDVNLAAGTVTTPTSGAQAIAAKDFEDVAAAVAGKERIDRVEVKTSSGASKYTEGVAALVGEAAVPAATAGYTTVAYVYSANAGNAVAVDARDN